MGKTTSWREMETRKKIEIWFFKNELKHEKGERIREKINTRKYIENEIKKNER